jgi:hypothetical protein
VGMRASAESCPASVDGSRGKRVLQRPCFDEPGAWGCVRTTANNQLGNKLAPSAVAKRRRRAKERLRTRLPTDAGAREV